MFFNKSRNWMLQILVISLKTSKYFIHFWTRSILIHYLCAEYEIPWNGIIPPCCWEYTMCFAMIFFTRIILMNPMHHAVTMTKYHVFLPIGVKRQSKKLFSAAISLGCDKFGPMKALETIQLVPIRSPGTSSCLSN